jgi:hypothetical protein
MRSQLQYARFEVFTAIPTRKVAVCDIETQFINHGKHITSALQRPTVWSYVRFEVFTAVTMKNVVFWDTKTQLLLHRKHNISATEPSQLMLCKIWYFYGGDYEECRLLRYKTPFRTSQETNYVSAAKTSQLILSNIWGFHGGDYEECRLLGHENPVTTSQET